MAIALGLLNSIYERRLEVGNAILAKTPTNLRGDAVVHGIALASIMLALYVVFHHSHGITLFSFHPAFMTLGFAFCFSEGILAYRSDLVREERKCAVHFLWR